ncbi:MAG: CBS domain-containing protein, partial [Planctomycetes bacterium]|nr:CBS domain-containing protein [Planctomycetota bacterium]
PIPFGGDCLRRIERELTERIKTVQAAAGRYDAKAVLVGILPTLRKSDLDLTNMAPVPRYHALNEALKRLRGDAFEFNVAGQDELIVKHDSVMLEACNTSCQMHFQVGADEFARLYNIAQAVAGPVLAAAVNSPLLFGQRLWKETRIALFQQAIDTRTPGHQVQERIARVSFGNEWVSESVLEILQEDVARFRVILGVDIDEDAFEVLDRGGVPKLGALQIHNSTVYRWNRPCYGICQGRPCLRIENRVLPAGPTVLDEVANAAFWFGLMSGVVAKFDDITQVMSFDTAKENFLAAAKLGLDAHMTWVDGHKLPAQELICDRLLPLAHNGLEKAGIAGEDIDRYLSVIRRRVGSGRTGSHWMLESLSELRGQGTRSEQLAALVAASHAHQADGKPVHEWPLARLEQAGGWKQNYLYVDQYMTTDLFTVHEDDVIDLVANLMDWRYIRHVPVEDDQHRLVGLVSYRALLRLLAQDLPHGKENPLAVSKVMQADPVTVSPETPTLDAIELMREHRVSCLPVVKDERLVGIVTERDFMHIAGELLEMHLRE